MKNNKRKWLKRIGIVLGVLLLLSIVVPLFIPVEGEIGLAEPHELIEDNGAIVTIPFDGTDGLDIYYNYSVSEDHSDKNFILLHGSLYNSKTWREVMVYFSKKGNVYAYDQLPYGLSEKVLEGDWTKDNPYTLEATLEEFEAYMDVLGIESATLVGSSYGGVIAAEAAIRLEDRVDELILVDPAILASESMPQWLVELPQIERLGPIFATSLASGDTFYESTFYNKELLTTERMNNNKRETLINNWNLALWEYLQAWPVNPSNVGEELAEISQRTLVISGEEDKIIPMTDSQKIAESIKNSTFISIPNCGHLPQEENPEAFIEIVDAWLSE